MTGFEPSQRWAESDFMSCRVEESPKKAYLDSQLVMRRVKNKLGITHWGLQRAPFAHDGCTDHRQGWGYWDLTGAPAELMRVLLRLTAGFLCIQANRTYLPGMPGALKRVYKSAQNCQNFGGSPFFRRKIVGKSPIASFSKPKSPPEFWNILHEKLPWNK